MYWKCFVWLGLGLFVLLSATDWVFTFALLHLNPEAMESNPFAAACLEQHGWRGLAVYKAGGVVVFVGAVSLMVRRRPVVASGVVTFGCAVLLSVTTYTHGLICEARRETAEFHQQDTLLKSRGTETPSAKISPHWERPWGAPNFADALWE